MNKQTTTKSSIKCVINHIEKKSICVSKLSARQRQKKKHTASIQDDFFFLHARMEICTEKKAHSSGRDNSYALKRHSISYRRRDGYFSHPIKDSCFFSLFCFHLFLYGSLHFFLFLFTAYFRNLYLELGHVYFFLCIFLFMIQLYMFFSTSSVISW